jgi:signal transduction histidine kinase
MRSRVAQVDGAMTVSPTPGGGLTVTIEVTA